MKSGGAAALDILCHPHFIIILIFLVLAPPLAHILPWCPFFILSFIHFSFKFWLIPGGLAWRNHHHNTKIPTPRGSMVGWPVLGHLYTHASSLAHRKFAVLAASSPTARRLMALSLGPNTRLIISSHPKTAKQILSGTAFSDRLIKDSARFLLFDRAIGFAPAGLHWQHLRRLAATHLFSPKRISGLEPLRLRLADEMVARVGNEMAETGIVEVRGILQYASLRNIVGSVLGEDDEVVVESLGCLVREGYDLMSSLNLADYFGVKCLDFFGVRNRCANLGRKVKTLIDAVVDHRRSTITKSHNDGGGDDFLSVLLSLPHEDSLSESDMVPVLWEMIFRGTDTVAILLEWIMSRMVVEQRVQAKAQKEIDACIGDGTSTYVHDTDLKKLPYLQAIVKEALRMHPPGPLLSWARLAIQDVCVDEFFIPMGTTAMVNMWAITHDPSIWKDPLVFRPERFMEGEDVGIMGSDLRLAPFGSGRRVCPGKALGLATVHLWLARLLYCYKWVPTQPVDMSERLNLSLEMKNPLTCGALFRR